MYFKVQSLSVQGLNIHPVEIEVDTGRGLPGMVIVGLPGKAIIESRDRVKTALNNTSMPYPRSRITVNLAPGDLKKEGPLYDLPIALGIMLCTEFLQSQRDISKHWLVGELSLDGKLRPVNGVLNMAQYVKAQGGSLILPMDNYREAKLVKGLELVPLSDLEDLLNYFKTDLDAGTLIEKAEIKCPAPAPNEHFDKDFSEVKGQSHAKRALMIAAAGGHNCLMLGPPGSGKSMLSERLPGILPPLTEEESLDITRVYSVAGMFKHQSGLIEKRPFRTPHHTISDIALIGGGPEARPGEISLAHRGILFMDEFPEFKRNTLEVLRQPMENGEVQIHRAKQVCEYPARFLLVAAMNPCPCGYYGSRVKSCNCTQNQIDRYLGRLSGPLLDRIDLHLEVSDQAPDQLRSSAATGLSTKDMKEKVMHAFDRQQHRYRDTSFSRNGDLRGAGVETHCKIDKTSEDFLINGMKEMGLSTRAFHKVLVVSRSIADLDAQDDIAMEHIAEALNYRALDQKVY